MFFELLGLSVAGFLLLGLTVSIGVIMMFGGFEFSSPMFKNIPVTIGLLVAAFLLFNGWSEWLDALPFEYTGD